METIGTIGASLLMLAGAAMAVIAVAAAIAAGREKDGEAEKPVRKGEKDIEKQRVKES